MDTSACVNCMRLTVVMVTTVIGRVAVTCAADFATGSSSSFWQSQAGVPNIGLGTYSLPVAGLLEGAVGRRLAGARWRQFITTVWKRPDIFTRPRGAWGRDAGLGDDEKEEDGEAAGGDRRSGQQFSREQALEQAALNDHPEHEKTGSGTTSVLGGPTGRQSRRVRGSAQRRWTPEDAAQHPGVTLQRSRQEVQETQRTSAEKRQSYYNESHSGALKTFFDFARSVDKASGLKT